MANNNKISNNKRLIQLALKKNFNGLSPKEQKEFKRLKQTVKVEGDASVTRERRSPKGNSSK